MTDALPDRDAGPDGYASTTHADACATYGYASTAHANTRATSTNAGTTYGCTCTN